MLIGISKDSRGKQRGDKEALRGLLRIQLILGMEAQREGRVYIETPKKGD